MKTAAFHTLGCKVNQYDTQAMLEKFRAAGYEIVPFDADADVYVINTCTVTGTGDKKSRHRHTAPRRSRRTAGKGAAGEHIHQRRQRAERHDPLRAADHHLAGGTHPRDAQNSGGLQQPLHLLHHPQRARADSLPPGG